MTLLALLMLLLAPEPLTLTYRPSGFLFAPANILVHVRVVDHPDNRALRVTLDCEDYYRSSTLQLDADRTLFEFMYQELPPGACALTAQLFRTNDRVITVSARPPLTVLGRE